MNPRTRKWKLVGMALATLLTAPRAEASFLDALGNLWETGKEKVGGLLESGKELLRGEPQGGGEDLEALLDQIEVAQETVTGKGDNVSEYLDRLNGRAPGAATRPFLRERTRDLETAQRTLGELYSRLGQTVSAAGGVGELKTEERQRIGLIQRQQQILVATAQQLDTRVDRALAGQPVPPSRPIAEPDGPLPPMGEDTRDRPDGTPERPADDPPPRDPPPSSREERPEPPAEEAPPPPPEAQDQATRVADTSGGDTGARGEPPETEAPEGVQSWGSYERSRRAEEEAADAEASSGEGETVVKADDARAFGGATGATEDADSEDTTIVKADSAEAFGGATRTGAAGTVSEGSGDGEEVAYGAAGRPGGTPEHPTAAGATGSAEGEGSNAEAGEGDEATVSVPGLATRPAPRQFDPEDPEMGAWVDEWLAAAGLDEYARWVSPAAITANGPADTGGLPRRTWVVAVHGDEAFGTNMTLDDYIAARLAGESPAVRQLTNPDGTPLGTQPGGSGPRSVPQASRGGPSGARSEGGSSLRPRDAQYERLRQALERGERGAIRDAYGTYKSSR